MVSVLWRTKSWSLRMSRPLAHLVEHHTTIDIHRFRRRSRNPLWGRAAETEEPECKWEWRAWAWEGCGCACYSAAVRYSTAIWSRKSRHEACGGWAAQKTKGPDCKWERGAWVWGGCEYGECKWKCFMYDVWCGMFTKGGPPSLTVNRLRDPAGSPPRPTIACHNGNSEPMLPCAFFFFDPFCIKSASFPVKSNPSILCSFPQL